MKNRTGFSAKAIQAEDCGYGAYHAPRYAFLLRLLTEHGLTAGSTVLDIGPSRLTVLIREHCGVVVDSLGFSPDCSVNGARHFEFDLNLAQDETRWRRDLPLYDCVVMAEVLEHLHTAPQLVLAFVKTLLAENGLLVIQTPNAASFPKRVKLLLGRNPYETIRIDPSNPGHFREYTISELRKLAEGLGFRVERCTTAFYFDARFARHQRGHVEPQPVVGLAKNFLYPLLPTSLREGITMVWRRKSASA
jgi:cyclopropane fatty-acyl-phospholipid synthase-like methyltransferase